MGTRKNLLTEAVLTCTRNLCFEKRKKQKWQNFSTENCYFTAVKIAVFCRHFIVLSILKLNVIICVIKSLMKIYSSRMIPSLFRYCCCRCCCVKVLGYVKAEIGALFRKSHPKDKRSQGSNPRPLVYKDSVCCVGYHVRPFKGQYSKTCVKRP